MRIDRIWYRYQYRDCQNSRYKERCPLSILQMVPRGTNNSTRIVNRYRDREKYNKFLHCAVIICQFVIWIVSKFCMCIELALTKGNWKPANLGRTPLIRKWRFCLRQFPLFHTGPANLGIPLIRKWRICLRHFPLFLPAPNGLPLGNAFCFDISLSTTDKLGFPSFGSMIHLRCTPLDHTGVGSTSFVLSTSLTQFCFQHYWVC